MRLKHAKEWVLLKEARAKDNGECRTNGDVDADGDLDCIAVHKKRSLSTNYEDESLNY